MTMTPQYYLNTVKFILLFVNLQCYYRSRIYQFNVPAMNSQYSEYIIKIESYTLMS